MGRIQNTIAIPIYRVLLYPVIAIPIYRVLATVPCDELGWLYVMGALFLRNLHVCIGLGHST